VTSRPSAWLAAALLLAATQAHAINKCVDKAGKVTYQEGRCPDDATQNQVQILAPPDNAGAASSGAAFGSDDPEDPEMLNVVSVLLGYEGCTKASPDFATTHAAQYETWRASNGNYLARLEHSARYQEVLAHGRRENAAQPLDSPEFREKYAHFCNVQLIPMLMRNNHR